MRDQELAPAKLSLYLGVHPLAESALAGSKHLVDAVFCELDLCDELTFEVNFEDRGEISHKAFGPTRSSNARQLENRIGPKAGLSYQDDLQAAPFAQPQLELETVYAEGAPALSLALQDNLVYRALQGFCRLIPESARLSAATIRCTLYKRIPAEAGLGGGSADAGAMLRLLGRLCGLELADPRLQEVAARLGSDVPFCLNGGCGLYDRFNDHLLQKLVLPPLDVAIVKPPYGISTAALYRAFDRFCPLSDQPAKLVTAIATGQPREAIAAAMHNNLFAVIEQEHPALCRLAKGLEEESGVLCVVLAGSGSSLIVICESRVAAEALASRYARQGYFSYAGTTIA